jgi:hypothetical protein
MAATTKPHVMVLPFPAQGHVTPFMELSHRLVDHGFQVTFVCTGLIHGLLLDAMPRNADGGKTPLEGIRLVSIPDGMAEGDDRRDLCKFVEAVSRYVPGYVEELIRETDASGEKKVKWLLADVNMGFCFRVAKHLGVRVAAVWPAAAASLGMWFRIPRMIEDGFIDDKGTKDTLLILFHCLVRLYTTGTTVLKIPLLLVCGPQKTYRSPINFLDQYFIFCVA